MTLSWLLLAATLSLVPLGTRGAPRLAALSRSGRVAAPGDTARPARLGRATGWARHSADVLVAVAGVLAVVVVAGAVLGLAAALVLATGLRQLRALRRRRAERGADVAAREAIRLVLAEVEAGTPPAEALAAAASGPFAAALLALAEEVRGGRDPTTLDGLPARLAPLAQASRVSLGSGAAPSTVLAAVAGQLAADIERTDAVTAELAGVRSSAALLAALPLVGLAMGAGLGADPLHVLATPAGELLVLAGAALESAGLLWTARLARGVEGR